jgi:hypothetical protein
MGGSSAIPGLAQANPSDADCGHVTVAPFSHDASVSATAPQTPPADEHRAPYRTTGWLPLRQGRLSHKSVVNGCRQLHLRNEAI